MRINDTENYKHIRSSITMRNVRKIIDSREFSIVKVAMNSKVSASTINAYISGQKIPSVPTLVSMGNFLNCNLDYLLDRTDNPININDLKSISENEELNLLIQNIMSLPREKQLLVNAYVQGLMNNQSNN